MKCPYCGEEMAEGCLESGRYIVWKGQDEQGKSREYLLAKSYMGGAKLSGHICLSCRKAVLDITERNDA